jgi:hypothetical protein
MCMADSTILIIGACAIGEDESAEHVNQAPEHHTVTTNISIRSLNT